VTRRLGVLLSGAGRTLENLLERIEAGSLSAEVAIVVSTNPSAAGLERARRRGVSTAVEIRSAAIFDRLEAAGVDLVCLAGFLRVIEIPGAYAGRVMNIHPSLLPAFGGREMYGMRVHEAVLASGARFSGCTVHYVTEEVDGGPIIVQRAVGIRDDDTPETLAARVFEEEKIAYPEAIDLHLAGRLVVEGKRVRRG
jgi:phosphoribosylglycinamide formyltransferase 1